VTQRIYLSCLIELHHLVMVATFAGLHGSYHKRMHCLKGTLYMDALSFILKMNGIHGNKAASFNCP